MKVVDLKISNIWPAERISKLIEMNDAEASYDQMALALQCTRGACYNKLSSMGIEYKADHKQKKTHLSYSEPNQLKANGELLHRGGVRVNYEYPPSLTKKTGSI